MPDSAAPRRAGRVAIVAILVSALAAGAGLWWSQSRAWWRPVELGQGALNEGLTTIYVPARDGSAVELPVEGFRAIAGDSSPLRFRACFTLPAEGAALASGAPVYPGAAPTVAPGWFDCFDAAAIGAAIETGRAQAVLSQADVIDGIDRVLAVYGDGRAYAWHQTNDRLETPSAVEN